MFDTDKSPPETNGDLQSPRNDVQEEDYWTHLGHKAEYWSPSEERSPLGQKGQGNSVDWYPKGIGNTAPKGRGFDFVPTVSQKSEYEGQKGHKDSDRKRPLVTWAEFVENTTFHGVCHVFERSSYRIRR